MIDIKDIKSKGEIYTQLLNNEAFIELVDEMKQEIEEVTEGIIGDTDSSRLVDKGIIMGIRKVIERPAQAVTEMLNNESEGTADQV